MRTPPNIPISRLKQPISRSLLLAGLSCMMASSVLAADYQKSLPILLSDYKKLFLNFQEKQGQLTRQVTFWKTSAFWVIALCVITCGLLGYFLSDIKKALSDKTLVLLNTEKALEQSSNERLLLNASVNSMSDKVSYMSDKLTSVQKNLSDKENTIEQLKQMLPKDKLDHFEQNIQGEQPNNRQ